MSAITAFIDTNAFLQFRQLNEWDWCALLKAPSVDVIVVPAVMRELEDKKHGDKVRLRKRATVALEHLERWFRDALTVALRTDVTLSFDPATPTLDFAQHNLSRETVDDWILAHIVQRGTEGVVLVTDDLGLQLKARSRGIAVLRPPPSQRLPPDEDEDLKKANEELRVMREQATKRPRIELLFENGANHLRHPVPPPYVPKVPPAGKVEAKRNELMKRVAQENAYGDKVSASFRQLRRGMGMTEEFDPEDLEQYLTSLRAFHEREDEAIALRARSFTIELLIRNSGRAPAEGVEVRLEVPEGVEILYGREARAPVEPALPRFFRSTLDFSGNHAANHFMLRDLATSAALHGSPPPWRWHFDRDDRQLRLSAGKIVHTDDRTTPKLRVAFPMVDDRARGFKLAGTVLVSNPPDEVHVELHIIPEASELGRSSEPVDD